MSPEQLQNKKVDARSDLFSFGCVLYELLTGTRAFDGASPASVIAAVLEAGARAARGRSSARPNCETVSRERPRPTISKRP
jgi:serine/threonine protein kinase